MGGRKRKVILSVVSIVGILVALSALLFLPLLIAVGVLGAVLIVVLITTAGPSQRRWDAVSRHEAEAAQRGDQSAFLGDRHDHTF